MTLKLSFKTWANTGLVISKPAWWIGWTFIRALKILYIDGLFLSKVYNVSARKFQRSVITLKGDAKFQRKFTCGLKNDLRNLVNFHESSRKSGHLHSDRLLLSKAYKDLDEKVLKSYVSWHWRVIKSFKKNWLLIPKNEIKNLVNFTAISGKSENVHFRVLLMLKVYYVWA